MTPTGKGWVVEIFGYHYYNYPHNGDKLGAGEFVRQTLIKNLKEGKVMLPTGEKVAGPDGTQQDKLEEARALAVRAAITAQQHLNSDKTLQSKIIELAEELGIATN